MGLPKSSQLVFVFVTSQSSHLHDVSAAATDVVIHDAAGTADVVGPFPHEEGVGPWPPTGPLADGDQPESA